MTAIKMEEAADRLKVSMATLRRMAQQNRIKTVKVSARRVVVPETEIARILGVGTPHVVFAA